MKTHKDKKAFLNVMYKVTIYLFNCKDCVPTWLDFPNVVASSCFTSPVLSVRTCFSFAVSVDFFLDTCCCDDSALA